MLHGGSPQHMQSATDDAFKPVSDSAEFTNIDFDTRFQQQGWGVDAGDTI